MASQDVTKFLASVGSPLVDNNESAPTKQLPATDVLKLLDARIEALAPPSQSEKAPFTNTAGRKSGSSDEMITLDIYHALEEYSRATAEYTHASSVSSILSDVGDTLKKVAELQEAVTAHDMNRASSLLTPVQNALASVGVHVDWSRAHAEKEPSAPLANYASIDQLVTMCERMIEGLRHECELDIEQVIRIEPRKHGMAVHTQPPPDIPSALHLHMSDAQTAELAKTLLENVFRPIFEMPKRWNLTKLDHGVELERTSDAISLADESCVAPLTAVLGVVGDAFKARSHDLIRLAQHLIPSFLDMFKTYAVRCIPTLHSADDMLRAKDDLMTCTMALHRALIDHSYVSENIPRTKHMSGIPEPLSDLPTWTRSFDAICKQHMLGCMVDQVRVWVLRSDDSCWDTNMRSVSGAKQVLVQKAQKRAPPSPEKPAKRAPVLEQSRPEPVSEPAPAPKPKLKKPTLGGVKIPAKIAAEGAAVPPQPPKSPPKPKLVESSSPESKDDWGWGEEDSEADPWETEMQLGEQAMTDDHEQPEEDDWGWGDEEEEVEEMVGKKQEVPGSSNLEQSHELKSEESAEPDDFDAWDWGDDPEEPEPEAEVETGSSPLDDASFNEEAVPEAETENAWFNEESMSKAENVPFSEGNEVECQPNAWQEETLGSGDTTTITTSSSMAVSHRMLEICAVLDAQWKRLDEGVSRETVAQGFYLSAQLFREMMPAVHAKALQHVALLGMLYVNDCVYLAQQLRKYAGDCAKWGTFRISAGHSFDAALRAEADLLDHVSARWQEALLGIQLNVLHECLDIADGFARTEDPVRYDACVRAVEQIQHILSHLVSVWGQVSSEEALQKALCVLVDTVFVRVLREMEDLQDISEPESNRLAGLCRMLIDLAGNVLGGAVTDVPAYFKFAYLPDILKGSLVDIEYLLFDNESGSILADYSREEMDLLVRALFADTPQRRRLLDRIQRWH